MRIVLAVGLVLLASALAAVLSSSPLVAARENTGEATTFESFPSGKLDLCQTNETVPASTSALHLWLTSESLGPEIKVTLLKGTHLLSSGIKHAGWRGVGVTVPIHRLAKTISRVTVCVASTRLLERMLVSGYLIPTNSGATDNGRPLAGRMRIRFLHAAHSSWWSMRLGIARRIGLGHAPDGTWVSALLAALMLIAGGLTVTLLAVPLASINLGGPWRSVTRPAIICALVALFNGVSWSIVSPAFQIDDEQDHFAYVQQLAETGRLPMKRPGLKGSYSPEEETALADLDFEALRNDTTRHALANLASQRRLEADLATNRGRIGSGDAGLASSEPPLFYALQTLPYWLGSGGTILLQLMLMRLLSALIAAGTAVFVYLFLREALPGTPWGWSTGALCAALAPLVGELSGSINPDAMLCAVSAGCFWCIARGFRRGLTPRLAVAIGAITAMGLLTKLNFLALLPGMLFGAALLSSRTIRGRRAIAHRWPILTFCLALSPLIGYALIEIFRVGTTSFLDSLPLPFAHVSASAAPSYIWQAYLPALPGMSSIFGGVSLWHRVWLENLLGLYGWDDIYFPDWVLRLVLLPTAMIAGLAARSLFTSRSALRARRAELGAYALMGLGTLALIGLASYDAHARFALEYRLSRYLLPLLAPVCAGAILAARGAGRRWGPALGALIVVLVLAHDIFSQLLVISRYYS